MNPEIERQQAEDVKRMRDQLAMHANLRNIALEDLETQKALVNGIKKVPQAKIIDQAQQLEHKILPAILQKAGGDVTNENYVYWRSVLDSLNWLLHVTDYAIRLEERVSRIKHQLVYYQKLSARLEVELATYTTMDRVITTDLITDYTTKK
jgi:hypothetical protein